MPACAAHIMPAAPAPITMTSYDAARPAVSVCALLGIAKVRNAQLPRRVIPANAGIQCRLTNAAGSPLSRGRLQTYGVRCPFRNPPYAALLGPGIASRLASRLEEF